MMAKEGRSRSILMILREGGEGTIRFILTVGSIFLGIIFVLGYLLKYVKGVTEGSVPNPFQ